MAGEGFDRRGFIKAGFAGLAAGCAAVPQCGAVEAAAGGVASPGGKSPGGGSVLRIAHLGDPQFGFGFGKKDKRRYEAKYAEDLARFEREIEIVNALSPDLVLVGGDMTHDPKDLERDWPRLLKKIKAPRLAVPGNHDTGIPVKRADLYRFRKVFGRDYAAMDVKGWRIIGGNTQYWFKSGASAEIAREAVRYEEWLAAELEKAKAYGGKVVLAGHIPPFMCDVNEKDGYNNHPSAGRMAKLQSYIDAGARFFLSAHLHRLMVRGWKELVVFNAETTCRNFDGRPYGFRMFEVAGDFSHGWTFHAV